jgi:aminoglycoside N3'-acetyltransferase
MTAMQRELRECLSPHGDAPLLIHSDLFRAGIFVEKSTDRDQLLRSHLETVVSLTDPEHIWIPTFNYRFPSTGVFDLAHSPSQLGPFDEFMRTSWAKERSLDPVFPFSSLTPIPLREEPAGELVAFSHQTAFSTLVDQQGGVLFYGAGLPSATIIHHVEFLSGGPLYRYDKTFRGAVIDLDGERREITYIYHVRPLGMSLDYDWAGIAHDLREAGIITTVTRNGIDHALYVNARELAALWLEKLEADPLYLLDGESRAWVEPKLDELGRRFQITDFEEEAS